MKPLFALLICLYALPGYAQQVWVTKKISPRIELQFPTEPQEMNYGSSHNWMALEDSTVFQLTQEKKYEKEKSNFRNCRVMLQGVLDESKGTLMQSDSSRISGYCTIYFTVKPTAEAIAGSVMKGFILDLDGRSYILLVVTERKDLANANRFIYSFKIH